MEIIILINLIILTHFLLLTIAIIFSTPSILGFPSLEVSISCFIVILVIYANKRTKTFIFW